MKTPAKVAKALHPPKEVALGFALPPVSARHYIALETIGSPVVGAAVPPRKPTLGDYAAAVALLRVSPQESAALANDPAALKAQADALVEKATVPDLQQAANAVLRRLRQALLLDDAPAQPPPKTGAAPAEPPPDPT